MQTESPTLRLRLLAIDEEYLIALDVQFILASVAWCHVDVETTAQFESTLTAEAKYDIVFVDPDPLNLTRREICERVEAVGARPIWILSETPQADAASDNIPWVLKPFSGRRVLEALIDALTPIQPEMAREVAAVLRASGP